LGCRFDETWNAIGDCKSAGRSISGLLCTCRANRSQQGGGSDAADDQSMPCNQRSRRSMHLALMVDR
jgi:hypothetical protein